MHLAKLICLLLFVGCFGIAAYIEPWHHEWKGARRTNALSMLIGDSRRLFANHFFAKADAYFHNGYYPTIFDGPKKEERSHMEESTAEQHDEKKEEGHVEENEHHELEAQHEEHEEHEEANFLGEPKDWIEAFGRNFFPSDHMHLGSESDFREILPWLRLTAELDPQKVETYTVAAFALRTRLNKPKEAEEFLRDGLRANPGSYEILYELGRLRYEQGKDAVGARNLLELALSHLHQKAAGGAKKDDLNHAQILGYLAKIEEEMGEYQSAITHLQELKEFSPFKDALEEQIQGLRGKLPKK